MRRDFGGELTRRSFFGTWVELGELSVANGEEGCGNGEERGGYRLGRGLNGGSELS